MLINSVFCVNNLVRSIINAKYTISMHTHYAYSTNNSIYLTLFPSLSTTKGSQFLLVNNDFSLEKRFFFLFFDYYFFNIFFYWLFRFQFFCCFGLISFFLGLFTLFYFCCNFLLEGRIIAILDFLKC